MSSISFIWFYCFFQSQLFCFKNKKYRDYIWRCLQTHYEHITRNVRKYNNRKYCWLITITRLILWLIVEPLVIGSKNPSSCDTYSKCLLVDMFITNTIVLYPDQRKSTQQKEAFVCFISLNDWSVFYYKLGNNFSSHLKIIKFQLWWSQNHGNTEILLKKWMLKNDIKHDCFSRS